MKPLTQAVILFAMLFTFAGAKAQSSQAPHLFDAFSNNILCNSIELEKIFSISEGSAIQVSLANNFIFKGVVINSVQRYSNLKSVLIKSSNFDAAVFAVSRRINNDNSITYVGRILNNRYADGYELVKEGNNYSLNKIKNVDILQERN